MSRIRETLREMRQAFVFFVGIGGIAFLVFYIGCLVVGRCYLAYDSRIVELGICLDSTTYESVTTVPSQTKQLYLCGEIEGTTPRPGAIYMYFNEEVVYTQGFEEKPGSFIQSLPSTTDLRVGEYRVEVYYARRLLAHVEFTVSNGS